VVNKNIIIIEYKIGLLFVNFYNFGGVFKFVSMKTDSFQIRHIGPQKNEQITMLQTCGVSSLEELIYKTIPDDIRKKEPLNLPKAMSEQEYMTHILELEALNKEYKTYIGMGYHPTIMPGVIQRNILENPGFTVTDLSMGISFAKLPCDGTLPIIVIFIYYNSADAVQ